MSTARLRILPGLTDRLIGWRRDLHEIPEPGLKEEETARYLARQIGEMGLEAVTGVAGTGLLVRLQDGEGPCVMLRADMDGLPIFEESGVPFASRRPGWMHACGHDAHMACLLGGLALLKEGALRWGPGRIVALFQPAEEVTPSGAQRVAASGLLDREEVDALLAQHVDHERTVGRIGVRPGAMMSQADTFELRLEGPGGHASQKGERPDPLAAAAEFHAAIEERLRPLREGSGDPVLCHAGTLHAGTAANVIPVEAVLTGTLRTFTAMDATEGRRLLSEGAEQIARARGLSCRMVWDEGGPPVRNDPTLVGVCRRAWAERLGADRLEEVAVPSLAAEDFGHLLESAPGVYWRLGIRGARTGGEPWHTPRFDLDEEALPVGAMALAAAAAGVLAHLARGGRG